MVLARRRAFLPPYGLAVDASGNVYVADTGNSTIRKITPLGMVSTVAGKAGVRGSMDGTGTAALFSQPYNVAVDTAGTIFVSDTLNSTIRKISPARDVTTLAGTAGQTGNHEWNGRSRAVRFAARFNGRCGRQYFRRGFGQSCHPQNHVSGSGQHVCRRGGSQRESRRHGDGGSVCRALRHHARQQWKFLHRGLWQQCCAEDYAKSECQHNHRHPGRVRFHGRPVATAKFNQIAAVAVDGSGTIFIGDLQNKVIRKITAGVVATLAGSAVDEIGTADGLGKDARFYYPGQLAVDSAGNVYVADTDSSTIRKVTRAGIVSTVAGGTQGSTDGPVAGTKFKFTRGIAVDSSNNIYVADAGNNTIRKITPGGIVSTLAGTAGAQGSADGTGAAARFNDPYGIAVDGSGNVYVADTFNYTIRKITPDGVVTTLAGLAGSQGSTDATGSAARFFYPDAVAVDSGGNVYVVDTFVQRIRKISPAGVVTTVAGAGQSEVRTAQVLKRVFERRKVLHWTAAATCTSRIRTTTRFAKSRHKAM